MPTGIATPTVHRSAAVPSNCDQSMWTAGARIWRKVVEMEMEMGVNQETVLSFGFLVLGCGF